MRFLNFLLLLGALNLASLAQANEVRCYKGEADYQGKISAKSIVTKVSPTTTIQTWIKVFVDPPLIPTIQYWLDEVTVWDNDRLQSVGLNTRETFNGNIKKQLWDYFEPQRINERDNGLIGYRIQASNEQEMGQSFPRFVSFWPLTQFALPWVDTFLLANPTRRPDLDLPPNPFPVHTPLAMGLYQVRFLEPRAQTAFVFYPGAKKNKLLNLQVEAPTKLQNGDMLWRLPLQLGNVKTPNGEPAQVQITSEHELRSMTITLATAMGDVNASLSLSPCED